MTAKPQPGIAAQWPTVCPRCPEPIEVGTRIVFVRGQAVHVGCYGGGDE